MHTAVHFIILFYYACFRYVLPKFIILACIGTRTKNVSIKVCNNTGKIGQDKFNKMATTMKNLQHPRLVPINGVFNAGETTVVVTEQMENGSLLERLKTTPIDSVQLQERLNMACQV